MNDQSEIIAALTELVIDALPDATMREMYGGTVIELLKDAPKSRIGGIYGYADHVSLEFTQGRLLDDPGTILEGSGKTRRHIKLRCLEDIANKDCKHFLMSAAAQKKNA